LGVAYGSLQRYKEAARACKKAVCLEPKNAEAHYWLGFSYGNLGRYKEAERELRKAIHLEPENTEAHFYLGLAYLSLWNHDGVEEQYEILRELDDEVADKFLGLINKVDKGFTDAIIKQCPSCGYEASVKSFGTWEKEGERGLLGKTPEGFIMFLCPQCKNHIKYDPLSDEFS